MDKQKTKLDIVLVGDYKRKEKGIDFFIEAIESIKTKFVISIIGNNDSKKIDGINFVSKMDTVEFAKYLLNQDIFISSSPFDTFPISVIEAMASGLIPIVTQETGVSSFITNKVNGFIVKYGDSNVLKNLLIYLKDEPEMIKKLSTNAAKIFDELSWDKVFDIYLKNFTLLLNEK